MNGGRDLTKSSKEDPGQEKMSVHGLQSFADDSLTHDRLKSKSSGISIPREKQKGRLGPRSTLIWIN